MEKIDFILWLQQSWVVIAAVAGGVTLVWNFFHKTLREIVQKLNAPITNLNSQLTAINKEICEITASNNLLKEALLTIQRNLLLNDCKKYLEQNCATLEEKETIIKQYKSYHDLGGDTFITDMVNQVKDLPVKGTSVIINRDEI